MFRLMGCPSQPIGSLRLNRCCLELSWVGSRSTVAWLHRQARCLKKNRTLNTHTHKKKEHTHNRLEFFQPCCIFSTGVVMYNIYVIICINSKNLQQRHCAGTWSVEPQSIDIIKGWTRATCVATILIAASEIDLTDPAGIELLKPLYPVLDRVWLVPVHVTHLCI